jgi:hypothetical protein
MKTLMLLSRKQGTKICLQMGCGEITMGMNEFEAFRNRIFRINYNFEYLWEYGYTCLHTHFVFDDLLVVKLLHVDSFEGASMINITVQNGVHSIALDGDST